MDDNSRREMIRDNLIWRQQVGRHRMGNRMGDETREHKLARWLLGAHAELDRLAGRPAPCDCECCNVARAVVEGAPTETPDAMHD